MRSIGRGRDGRASAGAQVWRRDYLDEEAGHELNDYVLTVPAQDLATTE